MEPGELCRSGEEPGAGANTRACPRAPARGWLAAPAVFPGGLAALRASPAAPGPVGNWGRGEQMFVIREQLMPERGEGGRPSLRTRSRVGLSLTRAILSRGLF